MKPQTGKPQTANTPRIAHTESDLHVCECKAENSTQPKKLIGLEHIDTCEGSLLHKVFRAAGPDDNLHWCWSWLMPYLVIVVLFAMLPIAVSMCEQKAWWTPQPDLKIPVLRDYSMLCMGLLTLPVITVLLLTERKVIPIALGGIKQSGILTPRDKLGDIEEHFQTEWERKYLWLNIGGQIAGVLIGGLVACMNYLPWRHGEHVPGWLLDSQLRISAGGWCLALWCLPGFYAVATLYIVRALGTSAFMHAISKSFKITPTPFHGDNAGGLSEIARIGLRNQYVLAVGGLNVVCLGIVVRNIVEASKELHIQYPMHVVEGTIAAAVFYLVAAPVVFVIPLLPFRRSMREQRSLLLAKIGQLLNDSVTASLERTGNEPPTEKDAAIIKRLLELKKLVGRCPVWPFDIVTRKHFFTAYLAPAIAWLITYQPLTDVFMRHLREWLEKH